MRIVPADRLDGSALAASRGVRPLDLAKGKERCGAQTRGGVSISTPAPA